MNDLRLEYQSILRLKNYSPKTIKQYTNCVAQFAKYYNKCPTELGLTEVKQYLLHLIDDEQSSWSKYRQVVCSLIFLYTKVLKHEWMAEHIPFLHRNKNGF